MKWFFRFFIYRIICFINFCIIHFIRNIFIICFNLWLNIFYWFWFFYRFQFFFFFFNLTLSIFNRFLFFNDIFLFFISLRYWLSYYWLLLNWWWFFFFFFNCELIWFIIIIIYCYCFWFFLFIKICI